MHSSPSVSRFEVNEAIYAQFPICMDCVVEFSATLAGLILLLHTHKKVVLVVVDIKSRGGIKIALNGKRESKGCYDWPGLPFQAAEAS